MHPRTAAVSSRHRGSVAQGQRKSATTLAAGRCSTSRAAAPQRASLPSVARVRDKRTRVPHVPRDAWPSHPTAISSGIREIARRDLGGGCRTLEELHTDDSGRWSVYEATVSDGAFGKGCTAGQASVEAPGEGADIVLSSTSQKADAIVQSIEIFDKDFYS